MPSPKVLGIILARGGSTRFPGKNLSLLGGIPLVAHAAARAREAELSKIVISTDSPEIAAAVEPFDVSWVKRPAAISGPEAKIEDAVSHALAVAEREDGCQYDYVVALQAACPVRPPGAIKALLDLVQARGARGGLTVIPSKAWVWELSPGGRAATWWNPTNYPRSQDIEADRFEEINSIQVTPRAEALAGKRWGNPLLLIELPAWANHDIDEPDDLAATEACWPVIEAMRCSVGFRWHMVSHPMVPKIQCPLDWEMGRGRIGVVLGNGPQIDALPDSFFRKLEGPHTLTVGVKRIAASKRLREANYAPDMTLQWDAPAKGQALTEAIKTGLERWAGRTWRLGAPEANMDYYPCDQILTLDSEWMGWPAQVKMFSTVTDAALNILARLGCEQVFLYGVELKGLQHCEIEPKEEYREAHDLASEAMRDKFAKEWIQIRDLYPKVKIKCAAKDSRLVRDGTLEFGEL